MRLSKICRQLLGVDPLIAHELDFSGNDLIFVSGPAGASPGLAAVPTSAATTIGAVFATGIT